MSSTALRESLDYMVARSLPLLLSDVSFLHDSVDREFLHAELGVSLRASQDRWLDTYRLLMELVHAIRTLQIATRHVIPACDHDLPFQLRLKREVRPAHEPGRIDLSSSVRTGALSTGRAIHFVQEPSFQTPEAAEVGHLLFSVRTSCRRTLSNVRSQITKHSPLLQELLNRLSCLLGELNQAVSIRPYLQHHFTAQSQNSRAVGPASPRVTNYRSVQQARALAKFIRAGFSSLNQGDAICVQHPITVERLYEFWCFCEFTRRLAKAQQFRLIQQSLIRGGMDSPVFSFGDNKFVFFEHRLNYFRVETDRVIQFREGQLARSASWIILRGPSTEDCLVVECCYARFFGQRLIGPIRHLVTSYNGRIGVAFTSEPPTRSQRSQRIDRRDKHFFDDCGGIDEKPLFVVHLLPISDHESLNEDLLDRLISRIGLLS